MGNNDNCPDNKDGYNADELIDSNCSDQDDSIEETIDCGKNQPTQEKSNRSQQQTSSPSDGVYLSNASISRSRVIKPSQFESGKTETALPRSDDTSPSPSPLHESFAAPNNSQPTSNPFATRPAQPQVPKREFPSLQEPAALDPSSRNRADGPIQPPNAVSSQAPTKPPESGLPRIRLSLPNGSEGKRFEAELLVDIPREYGSDISLIDLEFEFEALDQLGIKLDIEERKLLFSGIPRQHGELKIGFRYVIPSRPQIARPALPQSDVLEWFVNPDPRSLWKNLDPDPSSPYPKSASDHARIQGDSVAIAASVRGRSHAHEGTFRDDDFCVWHDPSSDWYLMIVCDGAGSAKYSRRGSEIACAVFREEIKPFLKGSLCDESFSSAVEDFFSNSTSDQPQAIRRKLYEAMGGSAMKAFKSIQEEAKAIEGGETKLFATTIISTISKRFSWGWFVGAFCIGDGGAAIYHEDGQVKVLNRSDGGEFAGQTRFLTMPEIWTSGREVMDRVHFAVCDRLTAVVAMTDGVSDPKFETDDGFKDTEKWHRFWQDIGREVLLSKGNANADKELLSWLNFWSPGNHDDRTLAILLP
jgi:hypothetical protein